jgi:hypothetical protein
MAIYFSHQMYKLRILIHNTSSIHQISTNWLQVILVQNPARVLLSRGHLPLIKLSRITSINYSMGSLGKAMKTWKLILLLQVAITVFSVKETYTNKNIKCNIWILHIQTTIRGVTFTVTRQPMDLHQISKWVDLARNIIPIISSINFTLKKEFLSIQMSIWMRKIHLWMQWIRIFNSLERRFIWKRIRLDCHLVDLMKLDSNIINRIIIMDLNNNSIKTFTKSRVEVGIIIHSLRHHLLIEIVMESSILVIRAISIIQ